MSNFLTLRTATSPYGDLTKGSVLSQTELDNNFIFLKGETIYTAVTSGNTVTLQKYNGNDLSFYVGSGTTSVIEITYNDFMGLLNTSGLTSSQHYLITDFQMVTYIQFSGGGLGSEDIHTGAIEPMVVQALSESTVNNLIFSPQFPQDIIYWIPDFGDREWDAVLGQSTGVITSREDTLWQIKRDFDFRNIVFRRWETISGSGVYDSIINTGFAYQDYPPFVPNNCFKCYIGSPLYFSGDFGVPYWLDNTIGKQNASVINIQIAYANNIEGFFDTNGDMIFLVGNIISTQDPNISPDFIYNSIGSAANNYVDLIDGNAGGSIQDNSRQTSSGSLKITNNKCGSIVGNVFDGEINRNGVIGIQDNTSVMPNCLIRENAGVEINDNTEFLEIEGNTIGYIRGNVFGGKSIYNNIGNAFDYNDLTLSSGDFTQNTFGTLNDVTFNNGGGGQGVTNNTFQANILGATITPTLTMESNQATQTVYDTLSGNCELTLSAGIISVTPI